MNNSIKYLKYVTAGLAFYLAFAPPRVETPTPYQSISPLESGVLLETRKGVAPNSPRIPLMQERPEYQPLTPSFFPTPERMREMEKNKKN